MQVLMVSLLRARKWQEVQMKSRLIVIADLKNFRVVTLSATSYGGFSIAMINDLIEPLRSNR